jgi:8-oxo-dGTP pyrophosphatase MutT (NUDIX family)
MPGVQRFAVAVAGLLIDNKKRVLLIRERAGARQYGLPGGLVQEYDAPEETLVREFAAQTGVTVSPDNVVGVRYRAVTEQSILIIAYRCRLVSGSARPTGYGDLEDVAWFDCRSLPSPMSSWVQPAIEAASLGGRGMILEEYPGEAQRRRQATRRRPKA